MGRNFLTVIVFAVFSAVAQPVNLQGVVSNTAGDPISGAIVSLVRRDLKDTTAADGKFSFVSTAVRKLPAIVPQSNSISIKNNIVRFALSTQSPIKVEVFDLTGNRISREANGNAAAGIYRFDITGKCLSPKVLIVKASIGREEVSFRYLTFKDGLEARTPINAPAAYSGHGLLAMAALVDTLKAEAPGYKTKVVALTSLINLQQNLTLDSAIGKQWPTANPALAGPFEVTTDKNVGPYAGVIPDPIYKNEQQRFNVYRPKNLATSGYLHPILIWANGYTDNPEQNPPLCITNASTGKWCGQYLPMMNHLASHGFVVVASLSTATGSKGSDGLYPTIAGMNWIIKQNDSVGSRYYHCLDTSKIGQLGHSFGGMSTCMTAADPRYKALATICGTRALTGLHTPILFYCGNKDSTVWCDTVKRVFLSVKNQPAFFLNELDANHGSWVYKGPGGVSLSSAAAWFRVFLMDDTANRKYFYGTNCTFCTDSRVRVEQDSLMKQ